MSPLENLRVTSFVVISAVSESVFFRYLDRRKVANLTNVDPLPCGTKGLKIRVFLSGFRPHLCMFFERLRLFNMSELSRRCK